MYVNSVTLKNIRGFERLGFSLQRPDGSHAGWTVFTGDNGSGKSTLLKAIALALTACGESPTAIGALQPSFQGWIREAANIEQGDIEINLQVAASDDLSPGLTFDADQPTTFAASLGLAKHDGQTSIREGSDGHTFPTIRQFNRGAGGWFFCAYGPFRRVAGASAEAARLMASPTTERCVTLFQEAASLFEVDQWLRKLSHKALEGKAEEKAQLALLLDILRDDLLPNQITVDRVDSDGLWLKDRNGLPLSWGDMSDGYRSAVALLTDILRHMIKAYGFNELADRDEQGKWFIKRSGVVLIDEIDAHLHPEWQRTIGFWLTRHFPLVQFLVTTHSPIICQAADENGLFVLPEPGSTEPPRPLPPNEYNTVIASRPDTILTTAAFGLQNTRSPRAVTGRAIYARLNAKKRAGAALSPNETQWPS